MYVLFVFYPCKKFIKWITHSDVCSTYACLTWLFSFHIFFVSTSFSLVLVSHTLLVKIIFQCYSICCRICHTKPFLFSFNFNCLLSLNSVAPSYVNKKPHYLYPVLKCAAKGWSCCHNPVSYTLYLNDLNAND